MNTNIKIGLAFIVGILITTGIFYFGIINQNQPSVANQDLADYLNGLPTADLSAGEIEGLLYMREEEKLARDSYQTLGTLWGLPVFNNIALSEQTHMDAVAILQDKYDLEDPAKDTQIGEFTNTFLQNLYDELMVNGSISVIAALRVGALIEEVDIIDLYEYMNETSAPDFLYVYNILLSGSENHLNAFVRQLAQNGVTYSPVLLSQSQYDDIVN